MGVLVVVPRSAANLGCRRREAVSTMLSGRAATECCGILRVRYSGDASAVPDSLHCPTTSDPYLVPKEPWRICMLYFGLRGDSSCSLLFCSSVIGAPLGR